MKETAKRKKNHYIFGFLDVFLFICTTLALKWPAGTHSSFKIESLLQTNALVSFLLKSTVTHTSLNVFIYMTTF